MYFKCLWYMYIVNIYMPRLKNLETVPNLLVKYFDFLSPFSKEDLIKKNIFSSYHTTYPILKISNNKKELKDITLFYGSWLCLLNLYVSWLLFCRLLCSRGQYWWHNIASWSLTSTVISLSITWTKRNCYNQQSDHG